MGNLMSIFFPKAATPAPLEQVTTDAAVSFPHNSFPSSISSTAVYSNVSVAQSLQLLRLYYATLVHIFQHRHLSVYYNFLFYRVLKSNNTGSVLELY